MIPKAKTKSALPKVIFRLEKLAPKIVRADEIALQTRAAAGKTAVDVKAGDRVTTIDLLPAEIAGAEKPKAPSPKPPDGSPAEEEKGLPSKRAVRAVKEPKANGKKPAAKKISAKKETTSKPIRAAAKKPATTAPAKIKRAAADPGLTLFDLDEVSPIMPVKAKTKAEKPGSQKSTSRQKPAASMKLNKDTKTKTSAKVNAKPPAKTGKVGKPHTVKKTDTTKKKPTGAAAGKKTPAEKPASKTTGARPAGKTSAKPVAKKTTQKAVPKPATRKTTLKK
jgi:hypothetical protein